MNSVPKSPFPFAIWPDNDLQKSSMRRTKKAYDPERHASQEDAERAVKEGHDKWVASGGADPKPKKPKADKPAKPDWKVQGRQRILQSPRSEPRQDNSSASLRRRNSPDAMEKGNRSMRRGTMRKSVPMGYSFDNPMPIPFHDDGLPNWDGVPHGCFTSLPMDNGPLKGKVVVLHRLQNGMYIISPDGKLNNPQNRDKDKGKLRKERPEVATDDNYGTEMTEKSLRGMRKGFSEKLRDEFLILAGYKPQQLRKADARETKPTFETLTPESIAKMDRQIKRDNAIREEYKIKGVQARASDAKRAEEASAREAKIKAAQNAYMEKLKADRHLVKKAASQPGKEPWRNRQGRPTLRGQSRRVRGPSGYVDTGIENNGLPGPEPSYAEKEAQIIRGDAIRDRREKKKEDTIKPYVEAMGYNPNDVYKHMAGSHHWERVQLEQQHADVPSETVQPKRDALAIKHQNVVRELIARVRKDHAKAVGEVPMPKELRPIAGLTRLHPEHFKGGADFFSRPADIPWDVPRNVPRAYIPDSDKRAE